MPVEGIGLLATGLSGEEAHLGGGTQLGRQSEGLIPLALPLGFSAHRRAQESDYRQEEIAHHAEGLHRGISQESLMHRAQ